ncbi:uncharacterized protein LOC114455908 isoform X2 [Gouania willdenowi]|uniref:uncharacterized protein LOC114455908 isoform X2 n=1 Tax=Gouania willdenowi TaxID=441366 RepID=UPI001054AA18|nr:uncharacterized protein LOC114455908 isoform X2 [Gouania willdenowi]
MMKPQEAELVNEISKLQCMVSELKMGFSSALLELSHIQHGDTYLREEMEENRRSCHKKARRMESLVEALREELGVMRSHMVQLYSNRNQQEVKKQKQSNDEEEDAPSTAASRGKLLLHCFLQGLKAGLSEGTDARHQVAMQLLHSEWEYVSTLNQLYDTYRTVAEPPQNFVKFVEELLQRHLLFRNTLQERLSAEHWKSLLGDLLLQLIGQNDTAFADLYVGYTSTLASFLFLELNRVKCDAQTPQRDREEMKLLSLLLAPVTRVHSYLSHIQNLLQWTSKDHPDCSLLLGSERTLRSILSRCHRILEEDVCWEESGGGAGQSCSDAPSCSLSVNGCMRPQQNRGESDTAHQIDGPPSGHPVKGVASMRVECWSCSPVNRRVCVCGCGHACCPPSLLLSADPTAWGENSDSGQGTFRSSKHPQHAAHGCQGDHDDTSAFDYSSVTSCSPDPTLCRETIGSDEEEEEEEEDSQVPVLLKPNDTHRERSVCLRWQVPRVTPHPPLRSPTEGLISSHRQRVVSVRKGSPPLHPNSAFRPIWDDPSKQADSAPEKESRQSFKPIQAPVKPNYQSLSRNRTNVEGGRVWEDSEDSEGPCSTV